MSDYTIGQKIRWEEPIRVRPVGRGGAVHTLHPDTKKTYCGAPIGRVLTESEMNNGFPWCRACMDGHTALVNQEQHNAYWTDERLRRNGMWPYSPGGPKHAEWLADQQHTIGAS